MHGWTPSYFIVDQEFLILSQNSEFKILNAELFSHLQAFSRSLCKCKMQKRNCWVFFVESNIFSQSVLVSAKYKCTIGQYHLYCFYWIVKFLAVQHLGWRDWLGAKTVMLWCMMWLCDSSGGRSQTDSYDHKWLAQAWVFLRRRSQLPQQAILTLRGRHLISMLLSWYRS